MLFYGANNFNVLPTFRAVNDLLRETFVFNYSWRIPIKRYLLKITTKSVFPREMPRSNYGINILILPAFIGQPTIVEPQ